MSVDQTKPQIVDDAVQESTRGKTRTLLLALLALCLASLIFSGWAAYQAYKPVQEQAQAGTDLAAQVKQACADPKLNTSDLKDLCDDADSVVDNKPDAVEGPQGDEGDPGAPGEPGPPPSAAQVANAVALYCAPRDACTGPKGDPGASVTQAQVAEAVATYCNARGECRGPEGATGATGQDGAQGTQGEPGAKGEQGPPPSEAQIADAVSNYCSTGNHCQGPKGDTGDPGPTGVVAVNTQGCGQQEGQVVDSVASAYDPETRTITITCTQVPNTILGQGGPG